MRGVLILLMVAVVVAAARPADACSCYPLKPACTRMFLGASFVGKAIKVVKKRLGKYDEQLTTTFAVSEVFHGKIGKTVAVQTSADEGACGKVFTKGVTYIVYANDSGPVLTTGSCTGTRPVDQAAEDLAYGRALPKRTTAVIDGSARILENSGVPPPTEIRVRGTGLSAKTDANGNFHLEVPPGKHVLEVVPGEVTSSRGETTEVEVPHPASCAMPEVDLVWNGRISGTLTGPNGKPHANVYVSAERDGQRFILGGFTGADGRYTIEGASEGAYRIVVSSPQEGGPSTGRPYPTTYYPGTPELAKAGAVKVGRGKLTANINFVVPLAIPVYPVGGTVRHKSGLPAAGVGVGVYRNDSFVTTLTTDAKGWYTHDVLKGQEIKIEICVDEERKKCASAKRRIDAATVIDLRMPR